MCRRSKTETKMDEALRVAARQCDPGKVDSLMRLGAKWDWRRRESVTCEGMVDFFQRWVGEQADPYFWLVSAWPLTAAKVDEFIHSGFSLSYQNHLGISLLTQAVESLRPQAVAVLLSKKADPSQGTYYLGRKPLMSAAVSGEQSPQVTEIIVRLLLSSKADVDGGFGGGKANTPLRYAAEVDGLEYLVTLLIAVKADPDCPCEDNRTTALQMAARRGSGTVVNELLEAKADVDFADTSGGHPLTFAAASGHIDVVRLLLAAKADVDLANVRNETALTLAASNNHVGVARLLLGAKADVERLDSKTAKKIQ